MPLAIVSVCLRKHTFACACLFTPCGKHKTSHRIRLAPPRPPRPPLLSPLSTLMCPVLSKFLAAWVRQARRKSASAPTWSAPSPPSSPRASPPLPADDAAADANSHTPPLAGGAPPANLLQKPQTPPTPSNSVTPVVEPKQSARTVANPMHESVLPVRPSAPLPVGYLDHATSFMTPFLASSSLIPDLSPLLQLLQELRKELLAHGMLAQNEVASNAPLATALTTLVGHRNPCIAYHTHLALCAALARNTAVCARFNEYGLLRATIERVLAPAGEPCEECLSVEGDVTAANLWLLCAFAVTAPEYQREIAHCAPLCVAIVTHIRSRVDERALAAAWLMGCVVTSNTSLTPRFVAAGVVPVLIELITRTDSVAVGPLGGLCHAVKCVCEDQIAVQMELVAGGVVAALGRHLDHTHFTVRSGASAALGALCNNAPFAQAAVYAAGLVPALVARLGDENEEVKISVAAALYNVVARCAVNQSAAGEAGALEALLALLPKTQGVVRVVEKSLATLLALVLKHSDNQTRFARIPGAISHIVKLVGVSVPRIAGLAAGFLRTLVAEQEGIQLKVAANGGLFALLDLVTSKDKFCQEQAVAALYNCMANQQLNKGMLISLTPLPPLLHLLTDCTKPSRLAYTCAILVLYSLCEEADFLADMVACPSLASALLRLCHPSCADSRLRAQADRLLRIVYPDIYTRRSAAAPEALLDALGTGTGACGPECAICMETGEATAAHRVLLPCFHSFHRACLLDWLHKGSDSCPNCRASVSGHIHRLLGADAALPG